MPTIKQLIKKNRAKNKKQIRSILFGSPQKKAICLKVYTTSPKKPNSADRKVAKVKLTNNNVVIGYIPGEGHSLQQHSLVLIEGRGAKDLPGVNCRFIRGSLDLQK